MSKFKELDDGLRDIRKNAGNRFLMEVKTELEVDEFYKTHTDLSDAELSSRLSNVKKYDDKFKTCILPIMIAIVFGIVVAISMAAISYQKASTVDVMYEAWEEASAKVVVTEENREMYDAVYKEYQHTVRTLYGVLIVLAIVVFIGVVVLIAPFDLWYDIRLIKSYQKNYEADYLEPILRKRRAKYIEFLQKEDSSIKK